MSFPNLYFYISILLTGAMLLAGYFWFKVERKYTKLYQEYSDLGSRYHNKCNELRRCLEQRR